MKFLFIIYILSLRDLHKSILKTNYPDFVIDIDFKNSRGQNLF